MIINPPRILLNLRPDAQPVEVTQEEYDETRKRICAQHPEMGTGELDEHIDYVLCTITRPGKAMEPGTITDPTQLANCFMADTASLRESLRTLHSAQVDEIRAVTSGLAEVKINFHADMSDSIQRAEKSAWNSDLKLTAAAKSIVDAIEGQSEAIRQNAIENEASTAGRFRLSVRDRWIQTGILAAGFLAVAGAILRGVL